jgi:hypothetical protein
MSEYKFNCPGCGQHILANEEWGGRRINCPSCNTRITVPSPAKQPKQNAPVMPPAQGARPKLPGGLLQRDILAKEAGSVTTAAPALPAPEEEAQGAKVPRAKEAKQNAPVRPPGQGMRPKLPGVDLRGKEAGRVTVPAGALPASGKGDKAATTPPAKTPKKEGPRATPQESTGPKVPGDRLRIELPVQRAEPGTTPATPPSSSQPEGEVETSAATAAETQLEAAATGTKLGEQPRVAVLSPAVKLDMVRAVRRRIADESAWLPGKVKGAAAYAGRMENGGLVLLDAKNPEATRFSLVGAFLREMEVRRVVRTATGRRRFLDEEIPEAIREVLLEQVSDEERERAEERLAGEDLQSISHVQCLAVLDRLEARYTQRVEQRQIESAKRRLGNVRLPELVNKLEKKVRLTPEEVATALYHELMEVRRRLERLEGRRSPPK